MQWLELLILSIYGLALTFILVYSVVQFLLTLLYMKRNRNHHVPEVTVAHAVDDKSMPFVTVQLPVYNEMYVVERLIDKVADLDYPKSLLEIQVLDDSTDETSAIIDRRIDFHKEKGIDIKRITRENRKGFKAGALAFGTEIAKGEFIAIFDADFLPDRNFLRNTVSAFEDKSVGMVQTRWTHINEKYSLLTKMQAIGLDAHFTIEQTGRNAGGHFINFNGTAGIWRKSCIVDAGGWMDDTLTEDLDLSYRAQLKGWNFKYLKSCASPAELPAEINALKTQQYRWNKGAAECSRKNLKQVLSQSNLGWKTKFFAMFHLLNSSVFICILITTFLSLPILLIKHNNIEYALIYKIAGIYLLGLFFISFFYFISYRDTHSIKGLGIVRFFRDYFLFLSISMGLCAHNGIAALEGWLGKKTPFIRTPKLSVVNSNEKWKGNVYLSNQLSPLIILESLLFLYTGSTLIYAIVKEDYGLLPFLIMLVVGFGYVSILTIKHRYAR